MYKYSEDSLKMNSILLVFFCLSTLCALLTGRSAESGSAVLDGAAAAVRFALELCGGLCFWSAAMELMQQSGLSAALSRLLKPLLHRLFPCSADRAEILEALSENLSANLLGLGNAATPAGIRAARGMAALGRPGADELCRLVVLNTASLQLLPTTIATVRAGLGAAAPFDILPAVWASSLLSVAAGLGAACLLQRLWRSCGRC